jgi:hypothetical protein
MLSKDEQVLLLGIFYACRTKYRTNNGFHDYNHEFSREQIEEICKEGGIFNSESGLSRALTNLDRHLLIERNRIEKPIKNAVYRAIERDKQREIEFEKESKRMLDLLREHHMRKPRADEIMIVKKRTGGFEQTWTFDPTKVFKSTLNESLKNIKRQRMKSKNSPKRGRISYKMTEYGLELASLLREANKWKIR